MPVFLSRLGLILCLALGLAACQSSEERAEEHYQSALDLIEQGDRQRAIVELRNVLQLDGSHREGRLLFAEIQRERGRIEQAYAQYLRVVEQYPDDAEATIALAEIAITLQDWEHIRRYGTRAIELAPENPAIDVIAVSLAYGEALDAEDASARRTAAADAAAALETRPDNLMLWRIVIDSAAQDGDLGSALDLVDAAIETSPEERFLYDARLQLLAQQDRIDDVRALLEDMVTRFPDDEAVVANLMRAYMSQGDTETAETFLRDYAAQAETEEDTVARLGILIRFLLEIRGGEAALEELDRVIAGYDADDGAGEISGGEFAFRAMRASLRFDIGQEEEGLAAMRTLLEDPPDLPQVNDTKVALARMLAETGNQVGARRLVAEVLEADPTHVAAQRLEASWLIDEDRTGEAIAMLRGALEAAPEDAQAMTLMAEAHLRNGDRSLARDFLSLAVEASGSAPQESLRYAGFLREEDRFLLAEEILIEALRLQTGNLALLQSLGEVYISMEDWPRAEQVEARLREIGSDQAIRLANGLQAARLVSQGRVEEAVGFLEQLAGDGGSDVAAQIAVIRARLIGGDTAGARSYAEGLVEENPDNLVYRIILAGTQSAARDYAAAAETYRAVLDANPEVESAWIGLVRALYAQGEIESAEAAVDEGLAALPEAVNLRWAEASFLEQSGQHEAAIEIYETLYERAPDSLVIANNLASLLSSHREDAESLERAYTIARRLRDSEFGPFQDTYGWILSRRGEHEDALDYLEPAAEALPEDPLVQYHLAATYDALGRSEEALEGYRRALELAGSDTGNPVFGRAEEAVARLEAEMAETGTGE